MNMFWAAVILAALATGLFQLGALSVWVVVLKGALVAAGVTIVMLAIAALWRRRLSPVKKVTRTP